ncbi:MAG TPA: hypothetical protein VMF11_06780 [Candidatus Baltobacteraceae bacterium]|nr:hypothetical protein [Candidatus Baltobacteraceae bacterium]
MVQAQLGYAADGLGEGIAYARLTTRAGERLVRVAFRVPRRCGRDDRVIAYAALTAIASMLREHGLERASFALPDAELVADCHDRREVPPPLVIPYVRLRCALNRFAGYELRVAEDLDLEGRARAELVLHPAA